MARMIIFTCAQCGGPGTQTASAVRRAHKIGQKDLFCGMECARLHRRTDSRTTAQKKADKKVYDAAYRLARRDAKRAYQAAYYRDHIEEIRPKLAEYRKRRMPHHVEYCRQPEYKVKKQRFDEKRRSSIYGEFAECHRLLVELKKEIVARVPNYYERHTETIKERSKNAKRQRA